MFYDYLLARSMPYTSALILALSFGVIEVLQVTNKSVILKPNFEWKMGLLHSIILQVLVIFAFYSVFET
jgi:hypothetical protein